MCCVHGRSHIVCLRLMTFQHSRALQTRIELINLATRKRPPNNLLILYWQFTKKNQSHLITLATNHMTHATKPSVSWIRLSEAQTSESEEPQTAEIKLSGVQLSSSRMVAYHLSSSINHCFYVQITKYIFFYLTLPPNAKHATNSIHVNCPYIRIFIELHNQFYTVWFGHETRKIQYWLALMRVSFLNLILF